MIINISEAAALAIGGGILANLIIVGKLLWHMDRRLAKLEWYVTQVTRNPEAAQ